MTRIQTDAQVILELSEKLASADIAITQLRAENSSLNASLDALSEITHAALLSVKAARKWDETGKQEDFAALYEAREALTEAVTDYLALDGAL